MLKESEESAEEIDEDTSKLFSVKRSTKDAISAAQGAGLEAGDPMAELVKRHDTAKAAALKACRNELKTNDKDKNASKMDAIKFSNNCIKSGEWVSSPTGFLTIGAYLYPKEKKGIIKRFFTGSMGNWGQTVGTAALKAYVEAFLGKSFAKQVTEKTVFDAVGDEDSKFPGRIAYYVSFKLNKQGKDLDESKKAQF